ncbi:MAG: hypothetical protein AAF583_01565 [Pseudomonadota bacterium]
MAIHADTGTPWRFASAKSHNYWKMQESMKPKAVKGDGVVLEGVYQEITSEGHNG